MSADASPQVYPFRHFERRFWVFSMIGCFAGGLAVLWGVATINGVRLIAVCAILGAAVGIVFWFWLRNAFHPVFTRIVQGPRRLAILASTVGCCSAAIFAAAALIVNRQIDVGPMRVVDATVLYAGRVVGPKVYGWDARFAFEGDSYYQMISAEHAAIASSASQVRLGLRKGLFGYEYIVAVEPKL